MRVMKRIIAYICIMMSIVLLFPSSYISGTAETTKDSVETEEQLLSAGSYLGTLAETTKASVETEEQPQSDDSDQPESESSGSGLEITVLALPSGGDCTIICYEDCQILVDSGDDTKDNLNLIEQTIRDVMSKSEDSVWDYVIFTHPDEDHIGNSGALFNFFSDEKNATLSIGTIIDYDFEEYSHNTTAANNYKTDRNKYIDSNKCSYFSAASLSESNLQEDFPLGSDCTLSVLYNHYDNPSNFTTNTNNISVCFLIEYSGQKILFTGDLEQAGENKLMSFHSEDLENITFFKANHHGSNTSNKKPFIDLIRPSYVAITSESSAYLSDDSLNNFLWFTDYIFPSYVEYNDSDYKLFGTTKFVFNKENVEVITECNSSAETIRDAVITIDEEKVNWFTEKAKKHDILSIYTLDEEMASYNNCSLIKYGHLDILIDCGSTVASSDELSDLVSRYVVDGVIECLIVTHFHTANISQLISDNGVLNKFKVNCLIDSSVTYLPNDSESGYYSKYLELADESNPNIDNHIRLDANEKIVYPLKDDLSVTLLAGEYNSSGDEDDCSMCALVNYRDEKCLFVGDTTDFERIDNKLNIENLAYYRASNSAVSFSGLGLQEAYEDALKNMNPKYTVIGSPIHYTMPSGAEFGSEEYLDILLRNCKEVYYTGSIDNGNKYVQENGTLMFALDYSEDNGNSVCLMQSENNGKEAVRLR